MYCSIRRLALLLVAWGLLAGSLRADQASDQMQDFTNQWNRAKPLAMPTTRPLIEASFAGKAPTVQWNGPLSNGPFRIGTPATQPGQVGYIVTPRFKRFSTVLTGLSVRRTVVDKPGPKWQVFTSTFEWGEYGTAANEVTIVGDQYVGSANINIQRENAGMEFGGMVGGDLISTGYNAQNTGEYFNARDMMDLRAKAPAHVDKRLRPMLLRVWAIGLLVPQEEDLADLLPEAWPITETLSGRIADMVGRLESADLAQVEASMSALRGMRPQLRNWLALGNARSLSPEQRAAMDMILERDRGMTVETRRKLLADPQLMTDLLYAPQAAVRSAAWTRLKAITNRPDLAIGDPEEVRAAWSGQKPATQPIEVPAETPRPTFPRTRRVVRPVEVEPQ